MGDSDIIDKMRDMMEIINDTRFFVMDDFLYSSSSFSILSFFSTSESKESKYPVLTSLSVYDVRFRSPYP